MIGFLKGKLVSKRPPSLMLEVGGVGYEIDAPMSTFYRLPEVGEGLTLVTHLVVREDAHVLYGFSTESERMLFRNLLKVSGVGARTALAVLSGMTVEAFYDCIRSKDIMILTRIPGVCRIQSGRAITPVFHRAAPPIPT
jgi:Holliday junction DNA helicase RuvA